MVVEFKYESIEKKDFIENFECEYPKIISVKNLLIDTKKEKTRIFTGKTYILYFHLFFYHQLQDSIGYFEIIKKYVPDINIVFFNFNGHTAEVDKDIFFKELSNISFHNPNASNNPHKYFEDMYDIYEKYANDKNIYNLAFNENYFFEELYFLPYTMHTLNMFYPESFLSDLRKKIGPLFICEHRSSCPSPNLNSIALEKHKQTISKYLIKDNSLPKKIYISRMDANKRYLEDSEKKDTWDLGSKSNVDSWLASRSNRFNPEEDIIVEYFKSKGYEIYNFEGMPYLEQIKIFHNATHVAGIIGSGFLNTFACDKNTNVFEIHVTNKYKFTYRHISEHFNLNYNMIDLRDVEKTHDDIFMFLDNITF